MEFKIVKTGAAVLMTAIVLALAGCPQAVDVETFSSITDLTQITVASVEAVSLGNPSKNWEEVVGGVVYLTPAKAEDPAGVDILVDKVDSASTVYYAKTATGDMEPSFETEANVGQLEFGNYIWVEVFSANLDAYTLYKIEVRVNKPTITGIALNGRIATLGAPAAEWNAAGIAAGQVSIGTSVYPDVNQLADLTAAATTEVPTTTVSYAFTTGTNAPDFGEPAVTRTQPDWLYVRGTAEDGAILIYKVQIAKKNDDTSYSGITVNSGALAINPANSYAAATAGTLRGLTNGNLTITGTKGVASQNVYYGVSDKSDVEPVWDNTNGTLANVPNANYVGIKVESEIGDAVYYKFRIGIGDQNATINTAGITVAGKPVVTTGSYIGQGQYGLAATSYNYVVLTASEAVPSALVAAQANETTATVAYGLGTAPSTWSSSGNIFPDAASISDGAVVTIQATSQDTLTTSTATVYVLTKAPVLNSFLPAPEGGFPSSGITLNYSSVADNKGNITARGGIDVENFGTPAAAWNAVVEGSVTLDSVSALANGPVQLTSLTPVANFSIAKTTTTTSEPVWSPLYAFDGFFTYTQATMTFANNDYLWVKVSTDPSLVTVYRIKITVAGAGDVVLVPETLRIGYTVDDKGNIVGGTVVGNLGTPGSAWNTATAGAVSLPYASAASGNTSGSAANPAARALIRYQKVTGDGAPDPAEWQQVTTGYVTTYPQFVFADNDWLYAELTLSGITNFYKIKTTVNSPPILTSLSLGSVVVPEAQWGTPAAAWNGPGLIGGYISGAVGNNVTVTPATVASGTDPAVIEYGVASSLAAEPGYVSSGTPVNLANGNFLYVKLTYGSLVNIYRIKINS
jgi:hypothetical protein